jgi:hypothetical protein
MAVPTVGDLLDGHVVLDVQYLDRIYLNGYVPNRQVVSFMRGHLGYPIPSPAILERFGIAFRRSVSAFAEDEHIPVVRFEQEDRKIEVMRRHVAAQARTGRSGVAAIGVAQEFQNVFAAAMRESGSAVWFSFYKADRRVSCLYVYLWDDQFGPAFVEVCSYFPYPIKVWINGHEWAKRQYVKAGIEFTELSNGFVSCADPAGLQAICDRLGPADIQGLRRPVAGGAAAAVDGGRPGRRLLVSCRCGKSKPLAPSCSTRRGEPAGSWRRWSRTTSIWAARTARNSSSP